MFACRARVASLDYVGTRDVSRDDDERFRLRPGAPRSRTGPSTTRYVSRVLRATERAGPTTLVARTRLAPRKASAARFGRGHVAAQLAASAMTRQTRRVIIKTRLVNLKRASPQSTARHLRYIERDGVGRNGEPGRAYGAETDEADLPDFMARSRDDRHQFRFIVSPEDAEQLDDLRAFTRDLMAQMERDLGTQLTWVAVDHWNTDDPHTHIVLRGKDDQGKDLVIARDYLAHGMRARARELATHWLGPRTEIEINASLNREVSQERWTSLDQTLQQYATHTGVLQLMDVPAAERPRLTARLQRLESLGLAQITATGHWSLDPKLEATLRALGERGDRVRTLQRAMQGTEREWATDEAAALRTPLIGRVVARGLMDEMDERAYVVVDALDGRAHYVPLPAAFDPAELPVQGIIELRGYEQPQADQNIVSRAPGGLYRPSEHLASLQGYSDGPEIVARHVRRLEALRRAGIVERESADAWRVPMDMAAQAQQYDLRRDSGLTILIRSTWSIEQQQRAMGATWLDHQLLKADHGHVPRGFGADVQQALAHRVEFLIEHGLAQRRGSQLVFARDLLTTLQAKELNRVGERLAQREGRTLRLPAEGEHVAGIYRRSLMLASGRFALLDDGASVSLVPWRSVMESRLGQSLSGIVRRGVVSWNFSRSQSLGR